MRSIIISELYYFHYVVFESTGIRLRIDRNVCLLKRPSFLAARRFRRLPFSVANSWRYVLKTRTFSRDGCFRRLKFIAGNSSLTLGRIRAKGDGGLVAPPSEGFFEFLPGRTSAPDVFSSCSFIPRTHFETSLVMSL